MNGKNDCVKESCVKLEKLHKLFFELSSRERMSILMGLHDQGLRLAKISRSLGLSPPEVSRHLQRLSEASLIQKDEDGMYQLTSYGKLVLSQIPALVFISNHSEYFNEKDYSGIPYELIERMGELLEAEFDGETADSLNNIELILNDAKDFIYFISNKIVTSLTPIIARKIGKSLDFKVILPRRAIDAVISDPLIPLGIQFRFLENVDALVIVTEGISAFGLPDKDGKFDYSGFKGTDLRLKKWCKDLFLYYWDKAKPAKF